MSSFMVEPKTINRVVSLLDAANHNGSIWASGIQRILAEHLVSVETLRDRQTLVENLFLLNFEAVKQRYGDTKLSTMPGKVGMKRTDYRYRYEDCSHIQAYKSLQCLIYQCSEGNVPETPLYKFLSAFEDTLARAIVSALPEYDRAEWA